MFRILIGITQIDVVVMGKMRVLEPVIGHQQGQWNDHQQIIQPLQLERMSMYHLMLQGRIEGQQRCQKRNGQPDGQFGKENQDNAEQLAGNEYTERSPVALILENPF